MAKTWTNVPCRFWTQNTENSRGNSEYRIWADRMLRDAPINVDRQGAQDQVYTFMRRSICYLDPKSQLCDLIMNTPDERITIDNVVQDKIYVNADGTILPASRRPVEGFTTFDFVNTNGDLSQIHVGHAVCNLKIL